VEKYKIIAKVVRRIMGIVMLDRTKLNILTRWYKSVDIKTLSYTLLLIVIGNVFIALASPIVASRIGARYDLFIIKNIIFSCIGIVLIIYLSFWEEDKIKLLSVFAFAFFLMLMVLVLVFGSKNKGAKRWLYLYGFSLQPSEIIKPLFVVTTVYILTEFKRNISIVVSAIIYIIMCVLLILQPDLGMLISITMVFMTELFLMDINYKYFILFGGIIIFSIIVLYLLFPYFNHRINSYINSAFFDGEKSYQIEKSIAAFRGGGLMGKGVFEGTTKNYIPDSHTDFIFSVIGEEFGAIICIMIIGVYFYIVLRLILKIVDTKDNFVYMSVTTLGLQFLLQVFINVGVTLNILPTKGITLPLISYGGSSMIGTSISIGFLLALTKKQYGVYLEDIYNIKLNADM
jgi:cell division protein FtsW